MPFVINPQFTPASGYRPVEWVYFTTINPSLFGPIKISVVQVILDGAVVGTFKQRPFTILGPGPVFTYGFRFDTQSIFQRLKAPKAQSKTLAFGTIGQQYNNDALDCYGVLELQVEYFYESSSGLLVNQGVIENSLQTPAFIATRQHEQDMSLDAYVPNLATLTASKLLTNAPLNQTICVNDSLFVNTIHGDADNLRVTTFDSAGAVIDEAFLLFPASGFNSQTALGVGPNELRNTTFTTGTLNIDNPNVNTYRITVGQGTAPFIPLSESIVFNLSTCCFGEFERLHFLNLLGGTDAFTFKSLNTKSQTTTSSTAQKPLNWDLVAASPHSINDRGAFKIDSRAVINRKLETPPLERNVAEWLAELLSSPEVYLQTPSGLVPVVIEDLEQDLTTNTDTELALFSFSITAQDANERIIQRN